MFLNFVKKCLYDGEININLKNMEERIFQNSFDIIDWQLRNISAKKPSV